MTTRALNVLFLCTGNSARSILAEGLLNLLGKDRFRAYSAGSRPAGTVHPLATELLGRHGASTERLRSKSWDEFGIPGAPRMDFVFTVCGAAAGEACPLWPGKPLGAHWGIDDPAAVQGDDAARRAAFLRAFGELRDRILVFTSLPLGTLAPEVLKKRLDDIGRMGAVGDADATSLVDRIQAASRPLRKDWRRRGGSVKDLLRPQS